MTGVDRLLDSWLTEIGETGWRKATVEGVAERAGLDPAALRRNVGDRIDALARFQDHVADEATAGALDAAGTVRDRLFDGLMRGFDALQTHRQALLKIWQSRDPGVAVLLAGKGAIHLRRLANAAGADISGVRGQLRLAALGAICVQTFRVWCADDSPDMAATMAELDRLLDKAEKAERDGPSPDLIGLPGLRSFFNRLPLGEPRATGDQAPPPSPDLPAG